MRRTSSTPARITEPAVGAGLGMAAAFFHPPEGYDAEDFEAKEPGDDEFILPDVSVIAAGYTENDSWFVGGGHIAHWRDDTIRYDGIIGYASLNLTYYGLEDDSFFSEGFKFNGEALFLQQPISFRLKESDFFLGAEYEYTEIEIGFDLGTGIPEIDELTFDSVLSGLRVFLEFENLDTPSPFRCTFAFAPEA